MKHKTKLLSLILAAVTILTAVFLASCSPDDPSILDFRTLETEYVTEDTLSVEPQSNPFISISASPVTVSVTEKATTLTQTLTATIIPVTAANKEVDWSVAWADTANTRNVTDYLTVTPKSSGSTTATVACFKPFEGNIIITVTTRDSGFWAQCVVDYVGKPTDIVLTTNLTPTSNGYHLASTGNYSFNVGLTNPLGTVGEQFNDIEVDVSAVGSVILGYREYYTASATEKWFDASDVTVELKTLTDKFISVSYNNGVLTVNTLGSIEDYYESMERIDGGRTRAYKNQFRSYVNDCYFTVTLTEKTSGLSKTIKIHFDKTAVASISLDHDRMSF